MRKAVVVQVLLMLPILIIGAKEKAISIERGLRLANDNHSVYLPVSYKNISDYAALMAL